MKTICMLSDMHPLFDDRIYWKEAVSLKNHGFHVIHIGFDKESSDFISNEGIRIIAIKKRVFSSNIFIHKLIKTLRFDDPHQLMMKKIVEVRADAYHIHDLKVNKLGRKIRKLPWKPKIIYDIHEDYGDMIRFRKKRNMLSKLITYLYAYHIDRKVKRNTKKYNYYLSVTPYIQHKFIEANPHIPSEIIYNYTNLFPDESQKNMKKEYDVLYSGLICRVRGVEEIIKAVKLLKPLNPDIRVLFIGRFQSIVYENEIKAKITSDKLDQNISVLPHVSYTKVADYYAKSRIGLGIFHPTKTYHKAIQIKTFEYMAFGLPIVCSNFGFIHKFVSESIAGISVNPLNPEEIAFAINKLLTEKELYEKYSRNGVNAAKSEYNWQSEENKLVKIYNHILKH